MESYNPGNAGFVAGPAGAGIDSGIDVEAVLIQQAQVRFKAMILIRVNPRALGLVVSDSPYFYQVGQGETGKKGFSHGFRC